MENPVNWCGYLSSIGTVRVVGISPARCAAAPCAVGSTLRRTRELLRVLRSYHNAKWSREL